MTNFIINLHHYSMYVIIQKKNLFVPTLPANMYNNIILINGKTKIILQFKMNEINFRQIPKILATMFHVKNFLHLGDENFSWKIFLCKLISKQIIEPPTSCNFFFEE